MVKVRGLKDGHVVNPFSSDFNDDELLNIAAGGGGERMGTRMLAAELLALRTEVLALAYLWQKYPDMVTSDNDNHTPADLLKSVGEEYMQNADFGPRWEAGE